MAALHFATWLGAEIVLVAAMALLAAPRRARALAALVVLASALALPWAAPQWPMLRFWMALFSVLASLLFVELLAERDASPAHVRLWMALTPADVRLARRVKARVPVALVVGTFAYAGAAVLGYFGVDAIAPRLHGVGHWVARWGFALVLGYCLFEAVLHLVRAIYLSLGVELPIVHDEPFRAQTIGEFWSRRWNRLVGSWLRRFCFWPLARRGSPAGGVAFAFVVSAAFHAWIALVVVDVSMSLCMGAFFLVQGGLVLLERALGVARWSSSARRAWTLTLMIGTSPLFAEPFLRFVPL